MILLSLGLFIWISVHFFKRLMPVQRQALQNSIGDASKGLIALLLVLSVVFMVIGYRGAEVETIFWGKSPAMTGINNILMLLAVVLFGLGSSKSRFRSKLRHPMLLGMVVWSVAHILVNGDAPSFFLFGALGLWAITEMIVINRAEPDYTPFNGGSKEGDKRLLIISGTVFVVISGVHWLLGYNPFGA